MIAELFTNAIDRMAYRPAALNDAGGWHSMFFGSSVKTKAGACISATNAETISAVWCATRVIADGLAALPCNLREHIDDRNTRTAFDNPLHSLVHDSPNSEMDAFRFFNEMVPFQVNWGNAYAEIQRDFNGNVSALWLIHPNRIPLQNIVRGPVQTDGGTVGQQDEIVYLVRNDDGTTTAIPSSDMLHVTGIPSGDGITGKGIVRSAAEALGVIKATEDHVGAFFRNGATPDIVVRIPSSVTKEERKNLRESWRNMHSGANNAHNMLLLVGDSEAKALGINPDDAQLLDSRKFGVEEVARFWKVPKHLLYSMDGHGYNSLELMNQSFLIYSLLPWIVRWEKALNHQLLTGAERAKFFFKFMQNALLRGDSAARSQFYSRMFDMGCYSINEIRELEDMNPITGGDRYFILANNRVPLDRIDDIALLQKQSPKPVTSTSPAKANLEFSASDESAESSENLAQVAHEMLRDLIAGLVHYECDKMRRAAQKPREFADKCADFYSDDRFAGMFRDKIASVLEASRQFGVTETAEQLTQRHITQSLSELLSMQDKPIKEFTSAVCTLLDSWSNRAAVEAGEVFKTQGEIDD